MDTPNTISILFEKYLVSQCSPEEVEELMDWLSDPANETSAKEILLSKFMEPLQINTDPLLKERLGKRLENILAKGAPVKRIQVWRKIAVAASILLVIGLGSYFLFFNQTDKKPDIVKVNPTKDIKAPTVTRAMITLTDGRQVSVDSLTSIAQGNVKVTKMSDGKIIYDGTTNEVLYNTLTNPRGSKVIDMSLADGSHVWLNAGSSVTYPIAFTGNERNVKIEGEAYFEVTHNASMPFTVSQGEMKVKVLGTHFNVNAYADEEAIKVTLLEGSVNVNAGSTNSLLKPGQQAQVTNEIKVVSNIDIDEVMAWKNGLFQFNKASVEEVMRQLERWYDVEVSYEGTIPVLEFGGKMQRELNLSEVLEGLKKSEVHFRIENKKIIVTK